MVRRPPAAGRIVGLAVMLATVAGCGPWTARQDAGFDLESFGGTIEESLPVEERRRRAVLARFLFGIMAGRDMATLDEWLPGVVVDESHEAFFAGSAELRRWDFGGGPSPDGIPVVLDFLATDGGRRTQVSRRVYRVSGRPGDWRIARHASADP